MTGKAARPNTNAVMGASAEDIQKEFSRVYRQELGYVWKVLTRLGARPADREDLAHDIFATTYRQWHQYDSRRAIKPWLFGIAYRVMLDFKRKHQNHREETAETIEATDGRPSAEEKLARDQGLQAALKAINALDLEKRAVFVMHEIEEIAMPEVATALEIPLNTAYSRLRLARRDFNRWVSASKTPWEVSDDEP